MPDDRAARRRRRLVYAGNEDLIEAQGRQATARRNGAARCRDASSHCIGTPAGCSRRPSRACSSRFARPTAKSSGRRISGRRCSAPPAPDGERLYLPLKDGRVVALSLQTGDEIWTKKLAEPAVGILPVGNRVFVGARDNQFHSLSADDGDADWRWPTGADLLGLPVLDAKRVYFIALDNILRGHNRNNGYMIWKQVLPFRPFTGPLLSGETLIVAGVAARTARL